MSRTLVLTAKAERDIKGILDFLAERSPQGAMTWKASLGTALDSIRRDPLRFAKAPEGHGCEVEARQILFKTKRGGKYRAVFNASDAAVTVLHVRGPNQGPLRLDEIT